MSLRGPERRWLPCLGEALALTCGWLSSRYLLWTGPPWGGKFLPSRKKSWCLSAFTPHWMQPFVPYPPSSSPSWPDSIPFHRFKSASINLHGCALWWGVLLWLWRKWGWWGHRVGRSPWCCKKSVYGCLCTCQFVIYMPSFWYITCCVGVDKRKNEKRHMVWICLSGRFLEQPSLCWSCFLQDDTTLLFVNYSSSSRIQICNAQHTWLILGET